MCTSKSPTIVAAAPPPPAPPPAAPEKAPVQTAGVRRKPGTANTAPNMAAGSLLTGPSGIANASLLTGGATLLGS